VNSFKLVGLTADNPAVSEAAPSEDSFCHLRMPVNLFRQSIDYVLKAR
jgi:hypothetical protein